MFIKKEYAKHSQPLLATSKVNQKLLIISPQNSSLEHQHQDKRASAKFVPRPSVSAKSDEVFPKDEFQDTSKPGN